MTRSKWTYLTALTSLLVGVAAIAPAHATEPSERREAMREKLKDMTPAERAAAREKAKARWEAMTPEQQAAAKKRMAERNPKLKERMADKAASPSD